MIDVLIIGGGPVGKAAALFLRNKGFSVRVIEKATQPKEGSRAIGIHKTTLEILEEFGLADRLIAHGVKLQGAKIFDGKRQMGSLEFNTIKGKFNFVLSVPQPHIEALLEESIKSLDIFVEKGKHLVFYKDKRRYVETTIHSNAGMEIVRSRYILGADGAHSVVRTIANLSAKTKTYPMYIDIADIRMEQPIEPYSQIHLNKKGGFLALIPISTDTYRIIRPVPDEKVAFKESDFPEGSILWHSQFLVHKSLARRGRKGRAVLCGDAFHLTSPLGGYGMNAGIQDAHELARLLKKKQLWRYSCRRRKAIKKLLRRTDTMTKFMFTSGHYKWKKRLFKLVCNPFFRKHLAKRNIE